MIELVLESEGKILGIKVRKDLTDRDYTEMLVPHLDWIVQEYGKARLLFSMEDGVEEPSPGSPWEAAAFAARYGDDIEKVAVAGPAAWTDWGTRLASLLPKAEVGIFSAGEWDKALDWLTP